MMFGATPPCEMIPTQYNIIVRNIIISSAEILSAICTDHCGSVRSVGEMLVAPINIATY